MKLIVKSVGSGRRMIRELSELTGASAVTIRRDIAELAEIGAIRRVRGGAEPAALRGAAYPFALRQISNPEAKQALARAAADLVKPGMSILLDNGTTALAIAHAISGTGVTALALSLHSAAALAAHPDDSVVVPGGPVGQDDLAFLSGAAVAVIHDMRFDIAFIGACAADPATGLTVDNWDEAQVKRAVIRSARRVVFVTTPDKFERTAAHRFGMITDLDTVITTSEVPAAITTVLSADGVDVITVPI